MDVTDEIPLDEGGQQQPQENDDSINIVTHPSLPPSEHPDREQWGTKMQFLLSCIGYAVGLGNVWRFPYLCFKNGGGSFLIPYLMMLIFEGIPLFFLELALGQWFQQGAYGTFRKIHPALGGIGLASGVCTFLVGVYYQVIIAWGIFYFFASWTSKLPWDGYECKQPTTWGGNCTGTQEADFWYSEVQYASASIEDTGTVQWRPALCLLASWLLLGACMIKGIQHAKNAVYFTATFPYVVLILLFFRGITLEGAGEGIAFYLKPDFSKLGNSQIWLDAAGQILYSLSPGFGTLIAYSSYNDRHNDMLKDALIVSVINCSTSVFAGFAIFAILGHMAHIKGVSVEDVVQGGPGLAFIAYPEAVLEIPGSTFWAIMFFAMLLTLGLDSQFGTVEAVLAIMDDLGIKIVSRDEWVKVARTVCFCTVSFLVGLLFCTNSGLYYFQLFDMYSAALPLLFICLCELITVVWIYGIEKMIDHIEDMTGRTISRWWWWMWKWATPAIISLVLFWSFITAITEEATYSTPTGDKPYPPGFVFLGWCLIMMSTVLVPGFALFQYSSITFSCLSCCQALSIDRLRSELTPPPRAARNRSKNAALGTTLLANNSAFNDEIDDDESKA
eukprot:m.29054 g.29054  ORF g.29054 m.29054 type:complete len:615 (+) comp4568_c0_seq1:91-1935(+)